MGKRQVICLKRVDLHIWGLVNEGCSFLFLRLIYKGLFIRIFFFSLSLFGFRDAAVKAVHHQDINMKILVALVVSSTLLGGLLLLLSCLWFYRLKKLKNSDTKANQNSSMLLSWRSSNSCLLPHDYIFPCYVQFNLLSLDFSLQMLPRGYH